MKRSSQSGVALVITLVLLSVITFMAVTFLVVSRHEAAQVGTLTQQSNAKFAADAAAEQAKALVAAQMLATTNSFNFGLLVSTNFITPLYNGSVSGLSITNVSYNGITSQAQLQQMLANLLILPRAPVFIVTNKALPNNPDFRFYLDLNRNGRFDTNGWIPERDINGMVIMDPNNKNNALTNFHVGDPEWIGILNHPEWPHSSSNLFVARFCYIALPIGNSLDFNYIHNQSQETSLIAGQDWGYLRNQGVGSWEINLAAFLAALNNSVNPVTMWPESPSGPPSYTYYAYKNFPRIGGANGGNAFDDAAALVQYRYNRNYGNIFTFSKTYAATPNAITNLIENGVDPYSFGPLMTSFSLPTETFAQASKYLNLDWSGNDNPSPLFTSQDLFGNIPGSGPLSFTNRLYSAGKQLDTYDQYTFYRMLSQISVGSAPDILSYPASLMTSPNYYGVYGNSPKMNLNYNNIGTNSSFSGAFYPVSATNFIPWTPIGFFTNAADRMLRAYFPNPIIFQNANGLVVYSNYISVTNIPIYPVNLYTPAVHRILQLAANMYDSTTNKSGLAPDFFDYPSVFQPYFYTHVTPGTWTNISVVGYREVTTYAQQNILQVTNAPKDLRRQLDLTKFLSVSTASGIVSNINVYGVPYVIGAKTNLPAFEKFASSPMVQMERKLEIVKNGSSTYNWHTNIQYTLGISNTFGVECWYSSTNSYFHRPVNLYVLNDMNMMLTNNIGIVTPNIPYIYNYSALVAPNGTNTWQGSPNLNRSPASVNSLSFKQPVNINLIYKPDSVVSLNPPQFVTQTGGSLPIATTPPGYFIPQFGFFVTNRVRVIIQDATVGSSGRILDYVQLGGLGTLPGLDTYDDITTNLAALSGTYWGTNLVGRGYPQGILSQYNLAVNGPPGNSSSYSGGIPIQVGNAWISYQPASPFNSVQDAVSQFGNFLSSASQTTMQVPFAVFGKYQKVRTWAANDPLVHYTVGDLTDLLASSNPPTLLTLSPTNVWAASAVFGRLSTNRYQPWFTSQPVATQLPIKDPMMTIPDNWQFPTQKFPNIGWLGRVHRGTPWQSVYLKSSPATNFGTWQVTTGNTNTAYFRWTYNNTPYQWNDPFYMLPTNDWLLMDLFTTAPNDNASRGQLSVNQTNVAAWHAVLDDVIAMSPDGAGGYQPVFMDPTTSITANGNTYSSAADYIINSPVGINATRTNFPGGVFSSAGQLLSVPALTVASPYLSSGSTSSWNDEAYERIPQQIMSLVRLGTPRYVIFAYGQSLQPADHSVVQSGQFIGMCTNYQITGEVATRSVVRFDNILVPGLPPGTPVPSPHAVVESFNVLGPQQ